MIIKTVAEAALEYARRGWAVIPVKTHDKNPWCNNGVYDATTDEVLVEKIFLKLPTANIGIACGKISGILVVDIDMKPHREIDGEETLRLLEKENGPLPSTPQVLTGSGGRHLYFKHPGVLIKNSVSIAPGIDIRSDGGYVVAPPSIHENGREYVWELSSLPEEKTPAEIPDWFLKLLHKKNENGQQHAKKNVSEKISQGTRNDVLFKKACSLRAQGLCASSILAAMQEENIAKCDPPLDSSEVKNIVNSACRYEPGKTAGEHLTDSGNSLRLVARHGQDLRYCKPWKKWLFWTGFNWVEDKTGEVTRRATETVINIYAEAAAEPDEKFQKAIKNWAAKSESAEKIRAMISLAESKLAILPDDFDKDPWLLNCLNGTLNLKTREFYKNKRTDFITDIAAANYNSEAQCKNWDAFQEKIMAGNKELIEYKRRVWGSCATGVTKDKALFIAHGPGGDNGKSTEVTVISNILNTYAIATPIETFLDKGQNDKIPNDLARLKSARLVSSIEVKEGRRLDEAFIKQVTGRDEISARFMRSEWFNFKPQFKIVLAVNHLMKVVGTDDAIWNRLKVIPYNITIPKREQIGEFDLMLLEERDGILNWMVQGCYAWQDEGLGMPDEISAAGSDYRNEMDSTTDFLAEKCFVAETREIDNKCPIKFKAELIWAAYQKWASLNKNRYTLTRRNFKKQLEKKGFLNEREGGKGSTYWYGIGLLTE